MCGIAGIYNLNNELVAEAKLKAVTDVLSHRGPDDSGYFISGSIGLGHRRLSIIDLSSAGHQPMFNEDGSLVIVFNGEIYNYLELIEELKTNHVFQSKSDTEVILHAYEEWGENCLSRFNGMWAFAIWDNKNKKLFCSRDRLGVKPFYYYRDDSQFIFASEIKAILAAGVPPKPNDQIIYDYLANGLIDHTENTFFKGIKQLPAAHYLMIEDQKLKIMRYWDLDLTKETKFKNEDEYASKFYELFKDSIRLRLRSDVPVGTCLSGGLDSSSIVCVANDFFRAGGVKNIGGQQKTFSACFDDKRYDERPFIDEVIKKTGAEKNCVFPSGDRLRREIERIVWHQDEPFTSTSIFAQWCVMNLAREKEVKVLLDGQGADELLAGYHGYFDSFFAERLRKLEFISFFRELLVYGRNHGVSTKALFKIALKSFGRLILGFFPEKSREFFLAGFGRGNDKFLAADFSVKHGRSFRFRRFHPNVFKNHLYDFLASRNLPALLRYEDRNSMAFAIEARVPFLDYRLAEYSFSLPDSQKMKNGVTKIVLRNALKGVLPGKVRSRGDKIGFAAPQETWLRTSLKEWAENIIASPSFRQRGYFNVDRIKEEFNLFCQGKKATSDFIWRCLNLEIWFRVFFDKIIK